ncbi:protein of unknown function [Magnetospirillum sp. XM-1]|nr:protein of unknown function [Magnetospirillum sp. XM-1]
MIFSKFAALPLGPHTSSLYAGLGRLGGFRPWNYCVILGLGDVFFWLFYFRCSALSPSLAM